MQDFPGLFANPNSNTGDISKSNWKLWTGAFLVGLTVAASLTVFVLLNRSNILSGAKVWKDVVVYSSTAGVVALGAGLTWRVFAVDKKPEMSRSYLLSELLGIGNRQTYQNRRLFFINGVWNDIKKIEQKAAYFRELTSEEMTIIHNASAGLIQPLETYNYIQGEKNDRIEHLAEMVVEAWLKAFKDMGDDGVVRHIAHSEGTTITNRAIEILKKDNADLLDRLYILAVAPSKYILDQDVRSVQHLAAKGDPVPKKADPFGRNSSRDSGTVSLFEGGVLDHSFESAVYRTMLQVWLNFVGVAAS